MNSVIDREAEVTLSHRDAPSVADGPAVRWPGCQERRSPALRPSGGLSPKPPLPPGPTSATTFCDQDAAADLRPRREDPKAGLTLEWELAQHLPGGPRAGSEPDLAHIAQALVPILRGSVSAPLSLAFHLSRAAEIYAATHHAEHRPLTTVPPGGLARWQETLAKQLLSIDEPASLIEIAACCRLSRSHFSRAFKQTTGLSPRGWQTLQRLERAGELLRSGQQSVAAVAATCGFADQSHLTRAFRKHMGITPSRWRRDCRDRP